MGLNFIEWYKKKVKSEWKCAFFATFIIGMLVHIYKFTNTLPNGDSIWNYYSDQNMIGSGRWFLSFACGISSFFDLPWVNGLLAITFMAIAVAVVVEILQIKNKFVIALSAAVFVTFPAITETLQFEFTADGYMIAMLLGALSVYFSRIDEKRISRTVLSIVLLCLCCGIYQAYVSFAIVLALLYFILLLADDEYSNKEYWKYVLKQVIVIASALALYFVIWKICSAVQGVQASDYQGIDGLGFSIFTMIYAVPKTIKDIFVFFFERNLFNYGITAYGVLNILFVASFIAGIIILIKKSKIYKRKISFVLLIVALVLIPFAVCVWHFTSNNIFYYTRMFQSLCLLYVFVAVVYDKYIKTKYANIVAFLLMAIVFNNSISANISYFLINQSYEKTYYLGIEMMEDIEEVRKDNDNIKSIDIVGSRWVEVDQRHDLKSEKKFYNSTDFLYTLKKDYLIVEQVTYCFLDETFGLDLPLVDDDYSEKLSQSKEVDEMGVWPADDSIAVIDDVLVVKIGSVSTEDEK